ncbi:MAG: biotin transporter BioY [Deltaproteobacteria bacterium]|nr:biotin transporter BioY [Deltaproteobacteria bacterium]
MPANERRGGHLFRLHGEAEAEEQREEQIELPERERVDRGQHEAIAWRLSHDPPAHELLDRAHEAAHVDDGDPEQRHATQHVDHTDPFLRAHSPPRTTPDAPRSLFADAPRSLFADAPRSLFADVPRSLFVVARGGDRVDGAVDARTTSFPVTVVLVAAGAAATAIGAQITVPLPGTPVPMTMQTLAVLLAGAFLGPTTGALSQTLYVALGALGLPVFAMSSGASVGYLLAFPGAAAIVGLGVRRWRRLPEIALLLTTATLAILAAGSVWLALGTGWPLAKAIERGFTPFLSGGAVKVLLATLILRARRR